MNAPRRKIEPNITEIQGATGVAYYAHISLMGKEYNKSFKTLEEARTYLLELKTYSTRRTNDYPYNLIEELRLNSPELDINYIEEHFEENLDFALSTLTEREALFIDGYYRKNYTYSAMALQHNLSDARIQQIVGKAIRKLRHPARSCYLIYGKEYLEVQSNVKQEIKELENKLITLKSLNAVLSEEIQKQLEEHEITIPCEEMTISDLVLTIRSYNCLKRAGIKTVADLISKTEEDMMKVRNLGRKSLKEIKEKLEALGLGFNKD